MKNFWQRMIQQFSKFRWKLTLSYFSVTVAALLMALVIVIGGVSAYVLNKTRITPEKLISDFSSGPYVTRASRYLSSTPPDVAGLKGLLSQFSSNVTDIIPIELGDFIINVASTNSLNLIYTDAAGNLIDTLPRGFIKNTKEGELLDTGEIPGLDEPFAAALTGTRVHEDLIEQVSDDVIVGAFPIYSVGDPELVVGVLAFVHRSQFREILRWSQISRQVGISLLVITLIAGVFGTLFGFWTSRGLTTRFTRLERSAQAWSQGDFSAYVDDPENDELGQLGKALNHMAVQLDSLLDERQAISIIEERNRLARELHDSVKQQAFAASAQLAAARAHYDFKSEAAKDHMLEAEKLVYEVRQELTDLIQELRPPALQGDGLVSAIRKYAQECETQMGIPVNVRVQGDRSVPLEIEQSLFRIVQGAMSNVARHSQARSAEIRLIYFPELINLSVVDDGVGFDPQKQQFGIGLRSIQERVELLDGKLSIKSEQGVGTKVSVHCSLGNHSKGGLNG